MSHHESFPLILTHAVQGCTVPYHCAILVMNNYTDVTPGTSTLTPARTFHPVKLLSSPPLSCKAMYLSALILCLFARGSDNSSLTIGTFSNLSSAA